MKLDINQIKEIIPHRHPFLLVDVVEDYSPGEFAIGKKAVSYVEPYFAGHYPDMPVMPGVLIIEALAQVGAIEMCIRDRVLNDMKWDTESESVYSDRNCDYVLSSGDVSSSEYVKSLMDTAMEKYGSIDVVVNLSLIHILFFHTYLYKIIAIILNPGE